ncbi:hypothetical protein JOB18_044620 [Solea senegalensis]|uniref:Uncharacterized protein n=1 Tax=Solea senegalensis TaxID=28829 RepID=A0AAV6SCL9_SOLSE|nr:hypothetical protein JOB18_044620 [Solea senegalensis]
MSWVNMHQRSHFNARGPSAALIHIYLQHMSASDTHTAVPTPQTHRKLHTVQDTEDQTGLKGVCTLISGQRDGGSTLAAERAPQLHLLDRFQSTAVGANHTLTLVTPLISAVLSLQTHHGTLHLSSAYSTEEEEVEEEEGEEEEAVPTVIRPGPAAELWPLCGLGAAVAVCVRAAPPAVQRRNRSPAAPQPRSGSGDRVLPQCLARCPGSQLNLTVLGSVAVGAKNKIKHHMEPKLWMKL